MVFAPTPSIRNVHLIAQHIPHNSWLNSRIQSLDDCHGIKLCKTLVMREAAPIHTTKNFLK